ncbi:response regulator receiver domain-containing protein [Phytobacter diazotrophicus]|nr:response regulator receiver domain-containing protein [Phytobacter diazotrophicus]
MNILIVEDDVSFAEEIKSRVNAICREPSYIVAESFKDASLLIESDFFDMIFLDLKLPTAKGKMDSDPQHGRNLLDIAISNAPGTPVFILTGSSAEPFLPDMMELSHQVDVWGHGKTLPLIGFHPKHRLNSLDEKIRPYLEAFDSVCEVELNPACDLNISITRLIKIFTASVGGVYCNVDRIGSGLSDASVYKLEVNDGTGLRIHNSIAKIGTPSTINDEVERHDRFISRLESFATPRKVAVLAYGAKKTSGVFYSLATASELNGFSFINQDSSVIIDRLKKILERWTNSAPQRRTTVKEIRETFIKEDDFQSILGLIEHDWIERFETNFVQVKWGCVHGDLHGLNVLVSPDKTPVLIDYGDVGERALSTDPITFELSTFFHPEGPLKDIDWPNAGTALYWGQPDFVDAQCPSPNFFNNCRIWAETVAVGKRERAAVAYGYLVRQLKYPDCNITRVNNLLAGVKKLFDTV